MSSLEAVPAATSTEADSCARWREQWLTPEQIASLETLSPWRVVRDALMHWCVLLLFWALAAWWTRWFVVMMAVRFGGSRLHSLFMMGQTGLERRLFRNPRVNDLFCDLLLLGPLVRIVRLTREHHLQHLRQPGSEADPLRWKSTCEDKNTRARFLAHVLGLTSARRALRTVYCSISHTADDTTARRRYALRDLAILVGWQVFLIVAMTWTIGPWAYPALWCLAAYLFVFVVGNLRMFAEHAQPLLTDDGTPRPINFRSIAVERAFFAPCNAHLHGLHHLWPSIPYYHLPLAEQLLRESPEAQDTIEWRGYYCDFLYRYLRSLPWGFKKSGK